MKVSELPTLFHKLEETLLIENDQFYDYLTQYYRLGRVFLNVIR